MTRSLSVTPNDNRAEFNYTQWSMILSWNNNNKRLRSRYYTVEATDGHKASRGLSATVTKDEYTCHLLHTDRMQLYTVSKKYTPWLLTVSCCNLSAILLINPLNIVWLSLGSHRRSSALSSLSDSAAKSESWLFLLVIVASTKTPLKYDCSFPLLLSLNRLDFWFMCVVACQLK